MYPCMGQMGFYYGMQTAFNELADAEENKDLPLIRYISLADDSQSTDELLASFDDYFAIAGDVCCCF